MKEEKKRMRIEKETKRKKENGGGIKMGEGLKGEYVSREVHGKRRASLGVCIDG